MSPGLGRCPAQEAFFARSGEGGKGFEKVVRKGTLGFENRHRPIVRDRRSIVDCKAHSASTDEAAIRREMSDPDLYGHLLTPITLTTEAAQAAFWIALAGQADVS